jgi:hypothetical protein
LTCREAAIIDARQSQLDQNARGSEVPYTTPDQYGGDENDAEEMPSAEWSIYLGAVLIRDGVFGAGLGRLSRYEAGLMKARSKTLQLLQENKGNKREPGDAEGRRASGCSLTRPAAA